jgi:hypothetical protein
MVKCRECGKAVSSSAKVCPNCGAPKPVRRIGFFAVLGALIVGLFAYTAAKIHTADSTNSSTEPASAAGAAAAPARPQQEDSPELKNMKLLAMAGAISLRSAMRNPDSFRLANALGVSQHTVCVTYRSQNGYGGLNVGHAVVRQEGVSADDGARWNRYCGHQVGVNLTDLVQAALDHDK